MSKILSVIYKITNTKNSKIYIGSSVNWKNRKQEHFRDLFLNKHHSIALQRAYNLYGKEYFTFEIIEYVSLKSDLIKREQFYFDLLKPDYNCCKIAGSMLGVKMTEEQRKENSLRNSGFKNSNCKLSEKDIKDIFYLRKKTTVLEISKKYKVNISTISRLLNNKSFKSLELEDKTFSKIYSDKSRIKLSNDAKNRSNSSKLILDLETGVFYNSLTELSNLLGIHNSTLSERMSLKYNPLPNYKVV